MKRTPSYLTPAEAGYYTNHQWESAFRNAFETLRSDSRLRERAAGQVRMLGTRLGLTKSGSSRNINSTHRTTQEGTHGKVR